MHEENIVPQLKKLWNINNTSFDSKPIKLQVENDTLQSATRQTYTELIIRIITHVITPKQFTNCLTKAGGSEFKSYLFLLVYLLKYATLQHNFLFKAMLLINC